jgi:hypothetical protein
MISDYILQYMPYVCGYGLGAFGIGWLSAKLQKFVLQLSEKI